MSAAATPHTSWSKLVLEAVASLHEKGGSSLVAIKKYLAGKEDVTIGTGHYLRAALKKCIKKGTLVQKKNSYKLCEIKEAKVVQKKKKKVVKVVKNPSPKALPQKVKKTKAEGKKAKVTSGSKVTRKGGKKAKVASGGKKKKKEATVTAAK